jgi:anti-sigma28 factor (negative regulator of flagellin synthesis)
VSDSLQVRLPAQNLGNTAAAQTERPAESSRTASSSAKPGAGAAGGEDSVELSFLSESIAAAAQVGDAQQSDRVRQLAALYASGKYHVDSQEISRAMVSQALTSPPAENDH